MPGSTGREWSSPIRTAAKLYRFDRTADLEADGKEPADALQFAYDSAGRLASARRDGNGRRSKGRIRGKPRRGWRRFGQRKSSDGDSEGYLREIADRAGHALPEDTDEDAFDAVAFHRSNGASSPFGFETAAG